MKNLPAQLITDIRVDWIVFSKTDKTDYFRWKMFGKSGMGAWCRSVSLMRCVQSAKCIRMLISSAYLSATVLN